MLTRRTREFVFKKPNTKLYPNVCEKARKAFFDHGYLSMLVYNVHNVM